MLNRGKLSIILFMLPKNVVWHFSTRSFEKTTYRWEGEGAHTEIDRNKLIVKLYHSKESQEQCIFDTHVL